ncbi:ferritin-like domain-containing protein [Spirosoma sp. KCTC 42546]|uniref:ferritin-like domain-containing protein n=1 Tax=Spirosoma sp. KCTC 42546 TaxID=2520506 RepID=UPI001FEE6309|nr:ferritin-like domain-containing protein [Spirosoma sp. KCTC 42546]
MLSDQGSIIEFIRTNINEFQEAHQDAGTSDFVTGILEKHEKIAWMLRTHLK